MGDFVTQPQETLFNSGIAMLQRIDTLRKACHRCKFERDYESWFIGLIAWKLEMIQKFGEPEEKKCIEFENRIKVCINTRIIRINNGLNPNMSTFLELISYETYLTKLMHRYGFGMPDKSDPGFALGR